MNMLTIDLKLCLNVFDAISIIVHTFSYLIIGFFVLVVAVNILIYCEASYQHHSEYLITLWTLTTVIYINILFIGLFGIPIVVVLEYMEKLDASQIDINVVLTIWMYIFWSGLVFKLMSLPFYYIFIRNVIHEKRSKIWWDLQKFFQ